MIIWSGWGFVVALIGTGWVALVAFLGDASRLFYFGSILIGGALAAAATYGFARLLGRRDARVLVDPASGERIVLHRGDSLFFVPVRYWSDIFLALACVIAIAEVVRT